MSTKRESPYTEGTLIQQTIAEYLETKPGWDSVYAHNKEDFGSKGLPERGLEREVVLARCLRWKSAKPQSF